ncbi:MAG: outer membrane protein transport protein [Candidatus Syntrophosphaera sp.]|nr:outer membrane protein transport protein [Candidatus Syntrophosphaera sp.]
MKILRFTVLAAVLLGISAALFAGGFALSGVGSRATSMGGAFRGMADDATAMFWNPAGLAFMDQSEISLGGTFIQPDSRWQNTVPLEYMPGFSLDELEAENKMSIIPTALGVFAKNPKAVFGLGVYVPYGLGATYDAYQLPASMLGNPVTWSSGFPENEMSSSVSIFDIHPSIAYKITDNLAFGVGISVFYGSIDLAQIKPSPTSSYFAPTTFDMSGTGIGFGGNAGIMYKPLKNLSLGFNGRFPSNIDMQGEAEVLLWLNNLANFTVWGGNNPDFLVAQTYGGKEDIDATLKLPGELGAGLSYKILPNLALNLDYAYTMWDRLDVIKVEMENPIVILENHPLMQVELEETELVFNWENTHRVSLGTEFRFGGNALRAGFFYDQSPITVDTQIPTLSDIGNKTSLNFGFGRDFGPITLDLNGQYVTMEEREVTEFTGNNMLGIYNTSSISGNIGLTYRF